MIDCIAILDSSGQLITSRSYSRDDETVLSKKPRIPPDFLSKFASRSAFEFVPPTFSDYMNNTQVVAIVRDGICICALGQKQLQDMVLLVVAILDGVAILMRRYYGGKLTENNIKAHFNTLYPMFDEVLAGGFPFSLELNSLEATVVPPSTSGMVYKIASFATSGSLSTANSLTGVSSEIWWRRANVVHATNKLYVDVRESVNCIITESGKVMSGSVSGRVTVNARLTGVPEVLLSVKNSSILNSVSFHPCVRIPRWEREQKLSFTPPDGECTIAEYIVMDKSKAVLPFVIQPQLGFDKEYGRVSISIIPKLNLLLPGKSMASPQVSPNATAVKPQRTIDDVVVYVKVPKVVASGTLVTHSGSVRFDAGSSQVVWTVGSVGADTGSMEIRMEGSLHYGSPNQWQAAKEFRGAATVQFCVNGWSPSGFKIDSLDVNGVEYTPYKGIRTATIGGKLDVRI